MALLNDKLIDPNSESVTNRVPSAVVPTKHLDLPEEVSTQEAAKILGCCKHTVLQYMEAGLLEWRNAAPPSSARPVFRFTLRSVLDIRLAYKKGSPTPKAEVKVVPRKRAASASGHQIKHLRRKNTTDEK